LEAMLRLTVGRREFKSKVKKAELVTRPYFQIANAHYAVRAVACRQRSLAELASQGSKTGAMVGDEPGPGRFKLVAFKTQEFLVQMLGTRRSSVTVAAGILQRAGIIAHTREM